MGGGLDQALQLDPRGQQLACFFCVSGDRDVIRLPKGPLELLGHRGLVFDDQQSFFCHNSLRQHEQ